MTKPPENRLSFGLDATGYRQYRPRYPRALFDWLAANAPDDAAALDCATGNGQVALDLAADFRRVCAFDASPEQIAAAPAHARVSYAISDAESLPYDDQTFSLIAVAQAAHWFDLPAFYREVRRVARPGCLFAVWGYSYCEIEPQIDGVVRDALLTTIEPYWANGNKVIIDRYRTIKFPFSELRWPVFLGRNAWSRQEYMNYLRTWSAVKRYIAQNRADPVSELDVLLAADWPDGIRRNVQFEFVGRVGRVD